MILDNLNLLLDLNKEDQAPLISFDKVLLCFQHTMRAFVVKLAQISLILDWFYLFEYFNLNPFLNLIIFKINK